MKFLVNAGNLHRSGGMAVGSSVISELSRLPEAPDITVLASSAIVRNLDGLGAPVGRFRDFIEFNAVGIRGMAAQLPVHPKDFDAVLNIFGPVYHPALARGSVMGFAQGWIAWPRTPAYAVYPKRQQIKYRLKYLAMVPWFLLANTLVVEQSAVRDALRERYWFRRKPIEIVSNTVDSVFWDRSRWLRVELPKRPGVLRLGVVSRMRPTKNLGILADVRRILRENHGLETDFFVTISQEEWQSQSPDFRAEVATVGSLALAEVPSFLSQLDGVVFTSLIESFSATPIETLATGVPLFTSDLPTIRETVGEGAIYFDPTDAHDIASKIAEFFAEPGRERPDGGSAAEVVKRYRVSASATQRATGLLAICRAVAQRRHLSNISEGTGSAGVRESGQDARQALLNRASQAS